MALALVSVTVAVVAPQSPAPTLAFEVATIRRSMLSSDLGGGGMRPGGRYRMTNVSPRTLVSIAFDVPSNRIEGPSWIASARYDLEAITKAEASETEIREMLRSFLIDRFKLTVRTESRESPIYAVVIDRSNDALGPGLRSASIDCSDPTARAKVTGADAARALSEGLMLCGFTLDAGVLSGRGMSLAALQPILTTAAGRQVVDRTGLGGSYNISLKWAPTLDSEGVSIFTAVRD